MSQRPVSISKLNALGKKGNASCIRVDYSWGTGLAKAMICQVCKRDDGTFVVVPIEAFRKYFDVGFWHIFYYGKRNVDYKVFKTASAALNHINKLIDAEKNASTPPKKIGAAKNTRQNAIEVTAKALESIAPDFSYRYGNNRQERYYVYAIGGLAWHGGAVVIKRLDKEKIKGGFRGELGYGFYFGASSKPFDYGSEITFIDINPLKLLDADYPFDDDVKSEIEAYSKKRRSSSDIFERGKSFYAEQLLQQGSTSIRNAQASVNGMFSGDASKIFAEIMIEIGYDGLQVGDNWQMALFPQEKLNDLLVDDPNKFIAKAYHKAKKDGSNPKLVDAVEQLLSKK